MNNKFEKNKFITNNKYNFENNCLNQMSNIIDIESELLTPFINKKDKNYKTNDINFYYTAGAIGPGKGFGNMQVSNQMRFGIAGRTDTKEFKQSKESEQLIDFKYQYLNKNYQDPKHIVMSIPRGGASTRKQNQLQINYKINNLYKRPVEFQY
jgi:hypothetical protein